MASQKNRKEIERLLGDPERGAAASVYGTSQKSSASTTTADLLSSSTSRDAAGTAAATSDMDDGDDYGFVPLKERGWSFQGNRRLIATSSTKATGKVMPSHHHNQGDYSSAVNSPGGLSIGSYQSQRQHPHPQERPKAKGPDFYLYCTIYALVNVIISAPGLYGYAAVIFNHPIFANHMNALSKLVIFSSLMHQLGFFLFSSLDFAIGTVQDAGLIFLSGMANKIANIMIDEGHSEEEIVSTTLVLLSVGTAALGLVLVVMGHFRLADAVSYLPMPVVGGYLAFIGFFCVQAGIDLCISKSIVSPSDWKYLLDRDRFMLAVPGLLAGLILTLVSRKANNSGALPLVMVAIPALFYFILWVCGATLDDVRDQGWVGPVAPSVPVGDLFKLVNFNQVRWDLIPVILPTWVGMVFVVSFASCLDVAAISIDMGEALDTNRELATVGLCNFMSGLTFGFTGSYIFSQTIFTYRTGVHSKFVGVLIMGVFFYITISPVNVLQISPLFFLGSTLIFIGYDLCWEWLWEVRHQVFMSEYGIVWLTFFAIHIVGIDAGIVLGVLIAIVEQIVTTAQTSSIVKVDRRSRAVWTPSDAKMLHDYAYSAIGGARIVALEMHGTVFFGSSLSLLNSIVDHIGLNGAGKELGSPLNGNKTPHTSSTIPLTLDRKPSTMHTPHHSTGPGRPRTPPKYLVLDLTQITHLDASATRGCFLQLVKMCAKRDIVVCASGATPRIEWMFRSHGVSIDDLDEESAIKAKLLSRRQPPNHGLLLPPRTTKDDSSPPLEQILLFVTVQEALEFCETMLLHRLNKANRSISLSSMDNLLDDNEEQHQRSLSGILAHMLGSDRDEQEVLKKLDSTRYHDEMESRSGDYIFHSNTYPDSFYIVLSGVVAKSTLSESSRKRQKRPVLSGAGLVSNPKRVGSASNLFDDAFKASTADRTVATLWQAGGVLGYNDYLMDKPRTFGALATLDGTKVARITHSHMNLASTEDPALHSILQKVLLHASTLDLANCTCQDV